MLILGILILIVLSAFFSASETAFSSVNQIRLKTKAELGEEKAVRVLKLCENYDNLLSTILIGNNIVNIAMSAMGTVIFTRFLGGKGPAVSTLVITLLVLIFGEITPKSMAKEKPEKFAFFSVGILSFLMTVCTPLNLIFRFWKKLISRWFGDADEEGITDAELMTMVSEAENSGDLTLRESELIRSAIEFDDVEVEEVLTPRVDVVAVSDECSREDLKKTFLSSGYSRLPVYHQTVDNIIGIVHEKDFFAAPVKENWSIDDLVSQTLYTTASTPISVLLRTLREQHHHMAVVVDEYGGTLGIITLEDILEELVGEIWDEHDEETEEFRHQSNGTWLVSGNAGISDLYEKLDISGDPDEIDAVSVSGLVQEQTNRLCKVGDRFTIGRYEGIVTKVAHRRVLEVSLKEKENKEKD